MKGNEFLQRRLNAFDGNANDISLDKFELVDCAISKMYGTDNSVLLFGSQVHGAADAESDFDIYVLFNRSVATKHDLRAFHGARLDVHVSSISSLIRQLRAESHSRFCFNVKSVSESIIVRDYSSVDRLKCIARSVYINPGAFLHWPLTKINFKSKLSGYFRERSDIERALYYCQLVQYCLRVLSIRNFGWFSRIDVMHSWMQGYDAATLKRLDLALSRANDNEPHKLYALCDCLLNSIASTERSYENISVSPDHAVEFYDAAVGSESTLAQR